MIDFLAGTYSCLEIKFVLARQFSFYLIQFYMPSFLLAKGLWSRLLRKALDIERGRRLHTTYETVEFPQHHSILELL